MELLIVVATIGILAAIVIAVGLLSRSVRQLD